MVNEHARVVFDITFDPPRVWRVYGIGRSFKQMRLVIGFTRPDNVAYWLTAYDADTVHMRFEQNVSNMPAAAPMDELVAGLSPLTILSRAELADAEVVRRACLLEVFGP